MNKTNSLMRKDIKKALILYDSDFENTKIAAMSLSRGFEAGGIHVDCISIKDFDLKNIENYDFLTIGPNKKLKSSKPLKSFLKEIKKIRKGKNGNYAFNTDFSCHLERNSAKRILNGLKLMTLGEAEIILVHPKKSCPDCENFPCEKTERFPIMVVGLECSLKDYAVKNLEKIGLNIIEIINSNKN